MAAGASPKGEGEGGLGGERDRAQALFAPAPLASAPGRGIRLSPRMAGREDMRHWVFLASLPMISGAVMFTPQDGKALAAKKLSVRSGQKFSPALSVV